MQDPQIYMIVAGAGLTGLAMLSTTLLAAWRGWLALKRQQMAIASEQRDFGGQQSAAGQRIEIADLKERIRKLEAIAAGVDL
ncbi:hypothetical protein [Sphingomonas sp.]